QKGIIHRDLKPSNVLITLHDGRPVPKVIDFGIAKAVNQRLTEKTLFTRFAQMIGTPAYMSPEQAETGDSEIDIRTDIYSLGILLYEMLTGTTPFAEEELHKAGYLEMQRIMCEEAPIKPSTRLSTLEEKLTDIAEQRKVAPDVLRKLIRGDLDWIVMKALEKDRNRRYETANELILDIERHLSDEPVSAGPPTVGYRLHKFVLRHQVAVITVALVTAVLAVGATTAKFVGLSFGPGTPEHAAGMVQRHLWNAPPMLELAGGISPDGRYLSYVDWTTAGNLAVRDLTTDTSWLLTKNTTWETLDGWAYISVISPDGKQIAYAWHNEKGVNFWDLRIIDLDGSNMRVLYHDPSIFYIVPYAWSPDGREILAYFCDAERNLVNEKTGELFGKMYLALVSAADGSVRVLKTWYEPRRPERAVFSPDGRYVAYDFGLTHFDVFMIELDAGSEIPLIEHPADDRLFGWAPDGRRILFASNRTSERSLWVIDVDQGAAREPPRLLKEVFVNGSPIGFTSDGSYYYGISTTASNVYLAGFDPKGLNFEGKPELVSSQNVGSTTMGDFSPDGKFLVYKAGRAEYGAGRLGPADWILVVYSVETGQERILTRSTSFRAGTPMSGPRWSPDGRSLLVWGIGQESGRGLFTLDVETGATTVIASNRDGGLRQAVWSPDGSSIYIRSLFRLSKLELATERETTLYTGPWGPSDFDVSPDGQWLAFYSTKDSLSVMSSTGGEPREVVDMDDNAAGDANKFFIRWTPDGEHLIFSMRNNELWKVNVATGEQQQIGPTIEGLVGAAMHPDGRQIAFTVEQLGSELWVMENFLPD
ncbi:MAG: serine/threonine-protein kinase, partial [Phycisphaerales bacterium]